MKMKKLAAALLAAAVLATTVAPTATPVFAATTAETTATDATPEQEVTVKKPAKATVAAKNDSAIPPAIANKIPLIARFFRRLTLQSEYHTTNNAAMPIPM